VPPLLPGPLLQVRRTLSHNLPAEQDRVCITFTNYVDDLSTEVAQKAQLTIVNKSNKKVLLSFSGSRSLTPRTDPITGEAFPGGGVTLSGRDGPLASPDLGVNGTKWQNAENIVIQPAQMEWDDFAGGVQGQATQ